jgi:hypothetical protein
MLASRVLSFLASGHYVVVVRADTECVFVRDSLEFPVTL